jgi:two-component system, NarL family, response regulator YdfI
VSDKIRVLITDDHTIVRDGLRLILETADHIEVVGEAENGRMALQLAAELQPDVILMDLRMPEMDGLTAIGYLQKEQPQIAVIILTTYNEDALMLRGLQAGARGYLLKDMSRESLIQTIEAAIRGDTLLKPEILQRVLIFQVPDDPPATAVDTNLTERELETLRAASKGETNRGIALRLGISARTVKAHLTSVYNKLGVDSRAAAIAVAARKGLLKNDN